ncbi:MAG: type I-E CRISPR-associated protein Cas6/Cse3/CasE [FCB group bacterium]|nr:type I-E CRISPR-associated protein Cas6/Cse3/CasE [FCB group bacterium]
MFLSHLLIDIGTNPDRERPGRKWLRNAYHIHQRLCMAFPSSERKANDPHFLAPYQPEDFLQVHTKRDTDSGFLFRIDPHPGGNVSIIVFSALKPDLDYAFGLDPNKTDPNTGKPVGNAGYLLVTLPEEPRPFHLEIEKGNKFRFRLTANPTRRLSKESQFPKGEKVNDKWIGKRVPVPYDKLEEWLAHKGKDCGFHLCNITNITTGYVYFNRTNSPGQGKRLFSARFDGVLEVTDSEKLRGTLISGIGSAKAFGFGLMTLAPV